MISDLYMRLPNVDMNLFAVFDAIYEEKNLTRAAKVLHVTQPAVSNSLRRLREVFHPGTGFQFADLVRRAMRRESGGNQLAGNLGSE
jgi:hypothetical protein